MTLKVGDKLPEASLLKLGASGPEAVSLADKLAGRSVIVFGLPGAFTNTCSTAHLPSFMRTRDGFKDKGVDEVICISVNDPFVLAAWGKATGAEDAGITLLGDADSAFTTAIGMDFTAPPAGFIKRAKRYALHAVDGEVKVLQVEEKTGVCELTAGEAMLDAM